MQHLPDHELLLAAESGTPEMAAHLAACSRCRARQAELLATMDEAGAALQEMELPPIDGARAMLRHRLREERQTRWRYATVAAAAACTLMALWLRPDRPLDITPRTELTPGAVRNISRDAVCAVGAEIDRPAIAIGLASEVFRRYGINDPQPRMYEVDYLVPPDLGGTAEAQNLWPQPFREGKWNSRVKDALEDRLRTMVCDGTLDLATAQQEIAVDWVGAYRKYFRSSEPLPDHVAFVKDRPWE